MTQTGKLSNTLFLNVIESLPISQKKKPTYVGFIVYTIIR